jgi:hypothetical protein
MGRPTDMRSKDEVILIYVQASGRADEDFEFDRRQSTAAVNLRSLHG